MRRYGWWENTVTTHADARAAWMSALTRSVDVDEDTGAPGAVGFPRLAGLERSLLACTASIAELPVRTNTRGWELTAHPSLESRRTAGFLREVVDNAEEIVPGRAERMMLHVLGPWSFGAASEFAGHPLVRDRPAFKDCALSLGAGVGEMATKLASACGVEVTVVMHEPHVRQVMEGLPGATQFERIPAVDREHVHGVWQRFLGQVGVPVTADCDGPWPQELPVDGFERVVIPAAQTLTTSGKDFVGELLGRGIRMGWATEGAPEDIARDLMTRWSQWTLEADALPQQVDVVIPEGQRSPAAASVAAARMRQAAELLWRN